MSIFSSILGGSRPKIGGFERQQQALLQQQRALYDSIMGNYQTQMREGAYDPSAQLGALQNDYAFQSRIGQGNLAANARAMGYRPGDSEPLAAQNAMSQRTALAYANQANQIRADAYARQNAALGQAASLGGGLLSSGFSGLNAMIGNRMQAAAQPSGFASLLGTVTPFLAGGFGSGRSTGPRSLDELVRSGVLQAPTADNPFYR